MAEPRTRRTRIVCISDTHNCTVKLPKGDVLIHAGDMTNQGGLSELSKTVKWLEEAEFEAKIVVAGNHDITLDTTFYTQHGSAFHSHNPQSHSQCVQLLTSSPSITYLGHEWATIRLRAPEGPRTQFTVFGSPFSPRYGLWAFGYDAASASDGLEPTTLWDDIPPNTDVVVTHTPPRGHCDETNSMQPTGCEALRRALWRVRPRLAVCGHIHGGRGAERILWNPEARFSPASVTAWEDPGAGNNKVSLVDLTGRKGPLLGTGETCVVNAAIMKSSYPHVGGKQFHKPIVVDVNLPICAEQS